MSAQVLWFLNRGTGITLVGVLTASVLLGILSSHVRNNRLLPAFVVQGLHRNVSLVGTLLLAIHIATAVLDEYVDITWWQAVVPVGATYQPVWLGLGAFATDLILLVVITSLVRTRIGLRSWRRVHLLSYAAWALGVVHGLGIGTDTAAPWSRWTYACSVGLVALAVTARLGLSGRGGQVRPYWSAR